MRDIRFDGVSGPLFFQNGSRVSDVMIWQWVNESRRLIGVYRASSRDEGELDLNETNIKWMTPNGLKPSDFNTGDLNLLTYVYKNSLKRSLYLFIVTGCYLKLTLIVTPGF